MGNKGIVYLIHFSRPLAHASHYVGWAINLEERLYQHEATRWEPLEEPEITEAGGIRSGHKTGQGSTLMGAVNSAGILWFLARTWVGDRDFERQIHNYKASGRLCPICAGQDAYNRKSLEDQNGRA